MIRLPPRSTLTDTLFPYTTLFRSFVVLDRAHAATGVAWVAKDGRRFADVDAAPAAAAAAPRNSFTISLWAKPDFDLRLLRSAGRRVGKECVSTCRSRRSTYP